VTGDCSTNIITMADYYSNFSQQQQQGGQQSTSYFGADQTSSQSQPAGQGSMWQPSTFATPAQQPQPQQPQQQQQQSNAGPSLSDNKGSDSTPSYSMPNVFNPALIAAAASATTGNSDDIFKAGIGVGKSFWARMIPGLAMMMKHLRIYFAVDNQYVKRKIGRVLFSFFYRNWKRVETEPNVLEHKFALPRSDDNALDLYLPLMSLITYVLLCGLCFGTAGQFSPEALPDIVTKCCLTQIFEVLLFRLGFYMMQAPTSFLELFSVTGYKYLSLSINMLVGLFIMNVLESGGTKGYFITFLWTASTASYFVLKTLAQHVPLVTCKAGPKREFMVLAFGGSQFATMWFLGQTKFLN